MSDHEIKLEYLKQRPQTNLEKLRFGLDQLDKLVGSLRYMEAEEARMIPERFDQVQQGFDLVEASGSELKGERSQWETIGRDFERQAASFIRILGGRDRLAQLRAARGPDQDAWWWFPERVLDDRRRSQAIRALVWLGLAAVLLIGAIFLYQRFLAPDQATQTSLRYSFEAENLAGQGDYQAAFDEVERAIAAKPGQSDLYLFKGVLAEILGRSQVAAQAFALAEAGSPDRVTFLMGRASEYLQYHQVEKAIADAQAALALDPQQASAYLILGQAYETNGDYQQALDNYRQADALATQQNDAQVQVLARMSIAALYNKLPVVPPTEAATPAPQGDGP